MSLHAYVRSIQRHKLFTTLVSSSGKLVRRKHPPTANSAGGQSGPPFRPRHCQPRQSQAGETPTVHQSHMPTNIIINPFIWRKSVIIIRIISLAYHSPGVTANRGESASVIKLQSSPSSVFTLIDLLSPFIITGRHNSGVSHCYITIMNISRRRQLSSCIPPAFFWHYCRHGYHCRYLVLYYASITADIPTSSGRIIVGRQAIQAYNSWVYDKSLHPLF